MNVLRFGRISGNSQPISAAMTDSEVVALGGGRFVSRNTSTGACEIADTTDTLAGWVDPVNVTLSTNMETTSDSTLPMYRGFGDVFRLPLAYDASSYTVNYSQVTFLEGCDLVVASYIQYANLASASTKGIIMVGGRAATGTTVTNSDGYVDVVLNPNAYLNLGVGA